MSNDIDKEEFYKMQLLEQRIRNTQMMLENAQEQLSTLIVTIDALNKFEDLGGKEDILFPLANGILAKAKLTSKDLMVNVGAGVVKKKSIKDVIKSLEEQQTEVQAFIVQIEEQYANLAREVEAFKDVR